MGKKGKKKQPQGGPAPGDQPAAAPGAQPAAAPSAQPAAGTSRGEQGDQPAQAGMKGAAQQKRREEGQGDVKSTQQESRQQGKGAKGGPGQPPPQQGQAWGRQQAASEPQQQQHPGQEQHAQVSRDGAQRQPESRGPPQQSGGRGQGRGGQQRQGGPPGQQQSWGPPQGRGAAFSQRQEGGAESQPEIRGPPQQSGGRGQGRGPQQHQGGAQTQPDIRGPPQQSGGRGQGRGPQQHQGGAQSQPEIRGPPQQSGGRGQGRGPQQHQGGAQRPPQWEGGRDEGRGAPSQQQQGGAQRPPQVGGPPQWGDGRGQGKGAPSQQQQAQRQPQQRAAQQGLPQPHVQAPPAQRQPQQRAAQQGLPQPHVQAPPAQRQPQQRAAQQGLPQPHVKVPPGQSASRSPSDTSAGSISSSVSKLQIARIDLGDANIVSKSRRNPGRAGRVIKVESNHLQLNLGQIKVAYHYDVNIVPDTPRKFMRPVVESFRRQFLPNHWPAFDGRKNIYTASPLSSDYFDQTITITEENGREKEFKVQVKFANTVDMTKLRDFLNSPVTPQEAIQVVDIVLRMAPLATCFPVGRSFFMKPVDGIIDLGEGMEMYHGFYQSAIRGWKPLLNVDVAHKAFPQNINVVDSLVQLLSTGRQQFRREDLRSLDRYQEETLSKFIKTLRIIYEIPGHPGSKKSYRVNGLGPSPARATFENNGQKMTILDYFARTKNVRLRYTELPTLWVGNPQRTDKVLLPIELCVVAEGQAVPRKMTEQQTSKMIRYAATDTNTRKGKIVNGIQRANYNQNPCVREFGFSVGNEFQKLDARVLKPPDIQYANRTARVMKGVWRNETFLSPVTINRWTIVNANRYPPRPDEYKNMVGLFEKSARDVGMTFTSKATEPFPNIGGSKSYSDVLQYFKSQKDKFDVIFVVVPDSGPQYSFVKKAAEIAVGCLTQCIKAGTVGRRMNPQTAVNLLLKVNSKLNGINHTFSPGSKPEILKRPVMIMGADVTHPGPDARDIPSVAAVTASHDPKAFQYNICWRLQNPKVEIIEDLEAIVIEHLNFFYKKTKVKPHSIVFFRDGVSEGQFEQVKDAEIRAIRAGCKKLQADGFEPKITFLVVQKRHHTRLFPMNPRDSEDRNCNVPAGTCVDTDITHPFLQDFYLVSHASIQGVAKPTKYCTLWDDNDMDNDQVEQLAYYLCHMFSRCTRSVSYPAPTYYAHLAAARAKVYIENDRLNMDRLRDEFMKFQIRDEIRKDLPMFFV